MKPIDTNIENIHVKRKKLKWLGVQTRTQYIETKKETKLNKREWPPYDSSSTTQTFDVDRRAPTNLSFNYVYHLSLKRPFSRNESVTKLNSEWQGFGGATKVYRRSDCYNKAMNVKIERKVRSLRCNACKRQLVNKTNREEEEIRFVGNVKTQLSSKRKRV